MELINLSIKNFLSIGEIKVPLAKRGLVLVSGYSEDEGNANGAGKSSFARNSICWCLFGETVNGVRGDRVINRLFKKDCSVSLEFRIKGVLYKVTRTRNPNNLVLQEGNRDISDKTEKQTQAKLLKIIGKSKELFLHSDVFGQGKKKIFMNLTAGEQKEIIENILPLNQLNQWATNATAAEANLGIEIGSLERNIERFLGQQQSLSQTKESLTDKILVWEQKRLEKIKDLQKSLEIKINEREIQTQKIEELEKKLQELDFSEKEIENQKATFQLCKEKSVIITHKIEFLETSCNSLKTKKSRLIQHSGQCNECGRPITELEMNKAIDQVESELEQNIESSKQLKDELVVVEGAMDEISSSLKEACNKQNEFNIVKTQLDLIRNSSVDTESIEKRIEELNFEICPMSDQLEEISEQLELTGMKLNSLKRTLHSQREEREAVLFWKKAFSKDIPIILFNQACPFLEERTNHYLTLLNNPQIRVQFNTIKELKSGDTRRDFNVTVESLTGGNDFDLLSGGEQILTNFAVCLALSDLVDIQFQEGSKFAILDECFTNLDQRNCDSILNFLSSHFVQKRTTILLISNEDQLKQSIPNRLNVTKVSGVTRLAKET